MVELADVLTDLNAETDVVDRLVAELPDDQWHRPTPAAGWTVGHQIAHLAWTDTAAIASAQAAAGDPGAWDAFLADATQAAGDSFESFVDDTAASLADQPPAALLQHWRAGRSRLATALGDVPDGGTLPWFGPPMRPASMATARLMETWAHGQDVADALGATRPATARLRHVAHIGVRTRDFAFGLHGRTPPAEPFRVELVGPDGEVWGWGPADAAQQVAGPALDFCLLVTQRRHRSDLRVVAIGPDADAWLDIAQAFAGPPGTGRAPA